MKNKNLMSLLAFTMIALFSVTLTGCGGEDEDPTPTKTDLQKAQEAIEGSVWNLLDARVTYNGTAYSYDGGSCDFSSWVGVSNTVKTNVMDFEYSFAGTNLSYASQNTSCVNQSGTYAYSVAEVAGKYVITYSHGGSSDVKFEIQNDVEDMEDAEISVKLLTLKGGATEAVLTFERQ
jgi:hypothetical protein